MLETLRTQIASWFTGGILLIVAGTLAGASALVIGIWARHKLRWAVALAIACWAVLVLWWWSTRSPEIDPQLPGEFRGFLPGWLFLLLAAGLPMVVHLIVVAYRAGWFGGTGGASSDGRFPELEGAWAQVLSALSQARIDPAAQPYYLIFGPDPKAVDEFLAAGELALFARAPAADETPIRAYAVAEGIYINVAGITGFGRGDGSTAQLEAFCGWLRDLQPELPLARGLGLVLPMDWATQADAPKRGALVRDDLQAIRSVLGVRCPLLVVLSHLEAIAGGREFLERVVPELRAGRSGCSVPARPTYEPKLVEEGLAWIARWFDSWGLRLMAEGWTEAAANRRILTLIDFLGRERGRLAGLLNAMLTPHPQGEPPLLRGLYVAACGPETASRGFVGGLIRGPRCRLMADSVYTDWSIGAKQDDARDRRLAIVLGAAFLSAASAIWWFGIEDRNRGQGWWLGLAAIGLIWAITLVAMKAWGKGRSGAALTAGKA
ncbi:MAG: type VI secretion protein IcmF/TssM N-terminal domain-containing protein [Isosphaeraceae bacterium]